MLTVKFWKFSKRVNSTAQPTGDPTSIDCLLKAPTSVLNPAIEIKYSGYPDFNYAQISAFGRYYFVSDIVSENNNIWLISLEVDPMASWKSDIGGASEYILRAASDYDGDIIDTLYPTKTDITFDIGSSVACFDESEITYIVGILNNTTGNKVGVTKYYAMTGAELANLVSFLFGNNTNDYINNMSTFITGMSVEIQNAIVRSLANPAQFIIESYALPYTPTLAASETLTLGYLPSYCTGSPLTQGVFFKKIKSITLSLPSHPMAATRGHYLSSAPYTRYILDLGPFGIYPLDSALAINYASVDIDVLGDIYGNISAVISLGGNVIDELHANVKCNFPIAQVSYDVFGAASAAMSLPMNTGAASSGDAEDGYKAIAGGITGAASGIMSGIKSLMPQCRTTGAQGTFLNAFINFTSRAAYLIPVDDDNTHRGRPLCQVKTISSLSGYILVSDPDLSIPGTQEENDAIKNYMANGFYYE